MFMMMMNMYADLFTWRGRAHVYPTYEIEEPAITVTLICFWPVTRRHRVCRRIAICSLAAVRGHVSRWPATS